MTTRNPSQVRITSPNAIVDNVTHFRLVLSAGGVGESCFVTVPRPDPQPDGTFVVSLDALVAALSTAYYGVEFQMIVRGVNVVGQSNATADLNLVVFQPIPEAPSSVVAS